MFLVRGSLTMNSWGCKRKQQDEAIGTIMIGGSLISVRGDEPGVTSFSMFSDALIMV